MISIAHMPSQMQGMDRKYDGHAWCKVITTNIKNSFVFSFGKVCCLGHLRCVQDDCEIFVRIASQNEMLWCGECTHIPVIGQIALSPFASFLACKFFHVPPLYVVDCSGQIFYVVHRLQSISRVVIHLRVHKHLAADGNCREFMKKTKRLMQKRLITHLMLIYLQFH
jgi:hypothetical protein